MGALRLSDETWGERYNRAFRTGKKVHDYTWKELAAKVSVIIPTDDSVLIRIGQTDTVPTSPQKRRLAYLALMAMGFDPHEFDLGPEDVSPVWHMPTVRRHLIPGSARQRAVQKRCFTVSPGQEPPREAGKARAPLGRSTVARAA